MLVFIASLALVVVLLLAEMPIAFAFGIGALARLRQLSVNYVDFHFLPRPK